MPVTNGTPGGRSGSSRVHALPRWLRWLIAPALLLAFLGLRVEGATAAADNTLCLALVIQLYLLIPGRGDGTPVR